MTAGVHLEKITGRESQGARRQTASRKVTVTLTLMRVAVVRSEKLVAEAGDSSETQSKENVRLWKPLPSNG
jgi:hypothetical protein